MEEGRGNACRGRTLSRNEERIREQAAGMVAFQARRPGVNQEGSQGREISRCFISRVLGPIPRQCGPVWRFYW
jgi:hypothetical protein